MPVIEVNHITKEYRLGALQGLKETFLNTAARLAGKKVEKRPLFKALDDVDFSIAQGEVLGIIGHNGAGKSTLLKMLARISTPTSGSVKVNGRIAPLIEVGAGFVPEFTGRENVYLNGSILGMSKKAIDKKFDEIVEFAEMAEFIDTPVKRYSSGMQIKLAFSVATSVESEILIVDEVLAVGDLAFQRKCFDRMEDLIKRQGRTVLIVSHNIRQIERLCTRVLLLDHGKVRIDGQPNRVCNAFYEQSDRLIVSQKADAGKFNLASTGEVELQVMYCVGSDGRPVKELVHRDNVRFFARIKVNKPLVAPMLHIGIHTTDFVYISTATSPPELRQTTLPVGIHELSMDVNYFSLLPGVYAIRFSVDVEEPIKNVLYGENLLHFTVISHDLKRTDSSGEGFFPMNESRWQIKAA